MQLAIERMDPALDAAEGNGRFVAQAIARFQRLDIVHNIARLQLRRLLR